MIPGRMSAREPVMESAPQAGSRQRLQVDADPQAPRRASPAPRMAAARQPVPSMAAASQPAPSMAAASQPGAEPSLGRCGAGALGRARRPRRPTKTANPGYVTGALGRAGNQGTGAVVSARSAK
jgi:hypothetical protein